MKNARNEVVCHVDYFDRYFQHVHFLPVVGVGKGDEYHLMHDDQPRQPSFRTTLRFTDPVAADSR